MYNLLGMDKSIAYSLATNIQCDNCKLPRSLSLMFHRHVRASLGGCGAWVQCKHLYHILQNIMYYRQSKSSFIIPHGVGMRPNVCWHMLKHLKANDIIIKLDLCQFLECLFCYHYSRSNMCTQLYLAMLVLVENFQG